MLRLGTIVAPYGEVAAVLIISGERYYHLVDGNGTVSMIPASVLEPPKPFANDPATKPDAVELDTAPDEAQNER